MSLFEEKVIKQMINHISQPLSFDRDHTIFSCYCNVLKNKRTVYASSNISFFQRMSPNLSMDYDKKVCKILPQSMYFSVIYHSQSCLRISIYHLYCLQKNYAIFNMILGYLIYIYIYIYIYLEWSRESTSFLRNWV